MQRTRIPAAPRHHLPIPERQTRHRLALHSRCRRPHPLCPHPISQIKIRRVRRVRRHVPPARIHLSSIPSPRRIKLRRRRSRQIVHVVYAQPARRLPYPLPLRIVHVRRRRSRIHAHQPVLPVIPVVMHVVLRHVSRRVVHQQPIIVVVVPIKRRAERRTRRARPVI